MNSPSSASWSWDHSCCVLFYLIMTPRVVLLAIRICQREAKKCSPLSRDDSARVLTSKPDNVVVSGVCQGCSPMTDRKQRHGREHATASKDVPSHLPPPPSCSLTTSPGSTAKQGPSISCRSQWGELSYSNRGTEQCVEGSRAFKLCCCFETGFLCGA